MCPPQFFRFQMGELSSRIECALLISQTKLIIKRRKRKVRFCQQRTVLIPGLCIPNPCHVGPLIHSKKLCNQPFAPVFTTTVLESILGLCILSLRKECVWKALSVSKYIGNNVFSCLFSSSIKTIIIIVLFEEKNTSLVIAY